MLLDPKAWGLITLDAKDNVNYPEIYLSDTAGGEADTTLMKQTQSFYLRGQKICFPPDETFQGNMLTDTLSSKLLA
jgi:hypothetical protein